MQRMEKVGPEIRAIQDRYKKYSMSDPRKRKMNEEVMAVYSAKASTRWAAACRCCRRCRSGGRLWRVLNGAIELRHAPWMGWIHDLSAKDPYYILPIGDGHHDVLLDENDAADHHRSVAAKNDGAHAADDGDSFSSVFRAG